ncbi:MAG: glycosyltransferase [Kiritimatiellae bacterium]|nr:glycosyltransferase [Kiritimatiellia bacterium]
MDFDVTVVTVVYELVKGARKDTFRQCVESVERQRGVRVEHVIVDGGSADGTKELVAACAECRSNVKWLSERDKGIYDAMNKGLGLSSGRYITFLNSDDYYHDSDGLGRVVSLLDSAKADFSYAPVVVLNQDGSPSTTSPHIRPDLRNLLKGMPFSHQSVLIRTSLLRELGGYDLSYSRIADYALLMTLLFQGKRAAFEEKDFVTFRAGGFSSKNQSANQCERAVVFKQLSHKYLGRSLNQDDFQSYIYACVLRTFGAGALRDGWFGAEAGIAGTLETGFRESAELRGKLKRLKSSGVDGAGVVAVWEALKRRVGVRFGRETMKEELAATKAALAESMQRCSEVCNEREAIKVALAESQRRRGEVWNEREAMKHELAAAKAALAESQRRRGEVWNEREAMKKELLAAKAALAKAGRPATGEGKVQ